MINYCAMERINKKTLASFSGDERKANDWLFHAQEEFGGYAPYDICNTTKGCKLVETHLDHQIYLLEIADAQTA